MAADLFRVGVPVYLPTVKRVLTRGSRTEESHVPMFPGYVFCSTEGFIGNPAVPKPLRSRVAQVLRPVDPEPLRLELRAIADLLTDRQLVQERVVGQVGETVRVFGGALTGSVGKIVQLKPNRYAVVVEVSLIGSRILAEIDESLLTRG